MGKQKPSKTNKLKINFSIDADVVEKMKKVADDENRNLSNFVETVLMNYCKEHEIG